MLNRSTIFALAAVTVLGTTALAPVTALAGNGPGVTPHQVDQTARPSRPTSPPVKVALRLLGGGVHPAYLNPQPLPPNR